MGELRLDMELLLINDQRVRPLFAREGMHLIVLIVS